MPEAQDRLITHPHRQWPVLIGVFTAVALAMSIARGLTSPDEPPIPVIFVQYLWLWLVWGAATPLMYRSLVAFPFTRKRWPFSLAAHLFFALLLGQIVMALYASGHSVIVQKSWDLPAAVWAHVNEPDSDATIVSNAIFYGFTLIGLNMIRLSRARRRNEREAGELARRTAELQAELQRAQLEVLRMQLNPHFLFNTLNSIASLVEARRNDEAYRTLGLLGSLLRETLERDDEHRVPLADELTFVGKYLEIEQIRFSDRLEVKLKIDDVCRRLAVPSLLLQPIVENSIKYGISSRTESGRIEITANRIDDRLLIRVTDDGPGLPENFSLATNGRVGLRNLEKRLGVLYAGDFSLRLRNAEPRGTEVEIGIPAVVSDGHS